MDKIVEGFLRRNLPDYVNKFNVTLIDSDNEKFTLTAKHLKYKFGRKLGEFEFLWCNRYEEYVYPDDKNAVPLAKELFEIDKNRQR